MTTPLFSQFDYSIIRDMKFLTYFPLNLQKSQLPHLMTKEALFGLQKSLIIMGVRMQLKEAPQLKF